VTGRFRNKLTAAQTLYGRVASTQHPTSVKDGLVGGCSMRQAFSIMSCSTAKQAALPLPGRDSPFGLAPPSWSSTIDKSDAAIVWLQNTLLSGYSLQRNHWPVQPFRWTMDSVLSQCSSRVLTRQAILLLLSLPSLFPFFPAEA
jgi:hypothetical protein